MPDICLFTTTSAILVVLRNGLEAIAQILKTPDLRRDDDTYTATIEQIFYVDRWVDVQPGFQVTIPITNMAGYAWITADAPIANGDVDLAKLRALLEVKSA